MVVAFITNQEQGVLKRIIEFLNREAGAKKLVFGEIEDAVYDRLRSHIKKDDKLFLSVNRKGTTKLLLESLLDREFVYVCNNEFNFHRNVNNLFFVETGDEVKGIFCGFSLTENNVDNSSSMAIYFSGKVEEIENFEILSELFNEEKNGYVKLTQEVMKEWEAQKAFRNEKASTISEELDEDEIVKSFRNMQRILDERQKELKVRDLAEKKVAPVSEIEIEINLD